MLAPPKTPIRVTQGAPLADGLGRLSLNKVTEVPEQRQG